MERLRHGESSPVRGSKGDVGITTVNQHGLEIVPALELVVSGIWRCSVCCWIDLLEALRTPCAKCRRSGSQATHEPRSQLMVSLKGHLAFTWSLELVPPSCPPKTENTGKSGNVDRMLAHRLGSVRTWLLSVWGGEYSFLFYQNATNRGWAPAPPNHCFFPCPNPE